MQTLICLLISWSISLSPITDNCKGEIKDGKKTGQWHCYYEDGKIMQEGPYQNDHKNGIWKFFHTNGKVALEGSFVNDVEKGQWKVFDEAGQQTDVIDYGN